jgi:hypothetical protein
LPPTVPTGVNGETLDISYASSGDTATAPVGGYSITGTLANGSGLLSNYTVTLNNGALTVNPYAFTYTIGNDSQIYGSPANLANDLPPTVPTGVNGETLDISYASSGDTATAPVGGYSITGTLSNGTGLLSNYNVTLNNGSLTVNQAGTSVSLNSSVSNSSHGAPVTFTAVVSGVSGAAVPTGTVDFFIDGVDEGPVAVDNTGTATYTTSTLTVTVGTSPHTITATYNGDVNYTGSSNNLSQEVGYGTFIWNGLGSDNLASDGANWVPGVAPVYGDLVIFNGTSSKTAYIDSSFANTLTTVEIDAGYTGQITLQKDLTINALLSQAGGTIVMGSNHLNIASAASYDMSAGELDGPGYLNIAGTVNWTGGSWDPGDAEITGALNIAPSSSVSLTGWTLNVDSGGNLNWTQGDVENSDSTVNVNADGTMSISSSGAWADALGDGGSSIDVAGTMNTTDNGSGSPVSIEAALNLTGSANVASGSVLMKGGGSNSGTFTIAANSDVTISAGTFTALQGAEAVGEGQVVIGGGGGLAGVEAAQGAIARYYNLTLTVGGTISGAGDLLIYNQFTWDGGTMNAGGTTRIGPSAVMTVAANVTGARDIVNFGQAGVLNGKTLTLSASTFDNFGTLTLVGTGSINSPAGAVATLNNHTVLDQFDRVATVANINKVQGGVATLGVVLSNNANLGVAAGDLVLTQNVTYLARSQTAVSTGAVLHFGGVGGVSGNQDFDNGAVVIADGLVVMDGPTAFMTVEVNEDLLIANFRIAPVNGAAFIGGGGNLYAPSLDCAGATFTGGITIFIGQGGTATIRAGCGMVGNATIDNTGTINWIGAGNFGMGINATITNDGSLGQGVFSIQTAGAIVDVTPFGFVASTGLVATNGGTISVDAGGGGNIIAPIVVNNGGKLNLNGRVLTLTGTYDAVGGDTNFGGSTGNLTVVAGGFNQTGGTTSLDGGQLNAPILQLIGGTFRGGGLVNADVTNGGLITFSDSVPSALLSINGNYTQTATGAFQVAFSSEDTSSVRLAVTGNLTLDGTVGAALNDVTPPAGGTIIMYGGDLAGVFAQVQGIGNNANWAAGYATSCIITLQS